ncbi:MAG: tyrosine-type recombinase/integrase [Luteolibacter sp.]|uniref:tyrosine-type recombinase/integrase n=1 Tax=Luteolibacter sp. TaxID=1962973 RepID=UPI00326300A4
MSQTAYQAVDSLGKRKYLTPKEGKDFLKAAEMLGNSERLLCQALFFLGCRVSEVTQLTKGDVDLVDQTIRVRCLKKRGKLVIRRVPVPEELTKALMSLDVADGEKIWPVSRMKAWRIVKEVMTEAGIFGIHSSPKGLRHAFGVRSALANIPVSIIQRWMGHSHPITTAIYLDVRDEEERKMIARTWL